MTDVKCAMCNEHFIAEAVSLIKTTNAETGIERIHYKCPHCEFDYTVAITNEYIRELMKKRETMLKRYNVAPTKRKYNNIEKLNKKIKTLMDELNGEEL